MKDLNTANANAILQGVMAISEKYDLPKADLLQVFSDKYRYEMEKAGEELKSH